MTTKATICIQQHLSILQDHSKSYPQSSRQYLRIYAGSSQLCHYNQIMYNTFQLEVDEDLEENNSVQLKNQLTGRTEKKFMSGTITKNFFASQYEEDDSEYIGATSPSKLATNMNKKQGENSPKQEKNSRRERKLPLKLAPIQQTGKVEVYQNYSKNSALEENEDISINNQEKPHVELNQSPDNQSRKRTQRRRTAKKQQNQQTNNQKIQKKHQQEFINLPKKLINTQIFFDDDDEEEIQANNNKQQVQQSVDAPIVIPQTRINNAFVDSEDDTIEVNPQQVNNIVTGSQYFNYNNEETLVKQLYLDIREKTTLKMEIIRDKGGFNTFWPEFHLHFTGDSQYVMSAKKTASRPTSTFVISRSRTHFDENDYYYLGKMKSNVLGDVLNIYGPGLNPKNSKETNLPPRQLLATVVFMTSLFQMGKPRQFVAYIKKPQFNYYQCFPQVRKYEEEIPLNTLFEYPENKSKIRVLHNRQPVWVQQIGGYMLNFKGRVQKPSIKNFILEEDLNGPDVMLFGKVNENKFNFDVSSKISTFVAFAIALSSFDSRIMCE